jgi:molecular chaperone DnaJ
MAKVKDYYEILGVGRSAGAAEIKSTYKKLARKYHPDLNPGDKAAEEKFKEISEAYAVLIDPKKREDYDNYGRSPFDGMDFGGPGMGGFRGTGFDFDFTDIFGDIFGAGPREAGPRPVRGADLVADVDVNLEEAFGGVTRKMSVSREAPCTKCSATGVESSTVCPACKGSGGVQTAKGFFRISNACPDCGGSGRKVTKRCSACGGRGKNYRKETVNVRIPAGVDDGSTVRLRGKGNAGLAGGPAGDLRLRVQVGRHALFERKGRDIYLNLPITFGEAALGAKVEVPTIDGTTMMTLPKGTQGGQRFKLSGKGFPAPGGGSRGNMYVTTQVAVPRELSKTDKDAIGEIEKAYREDPRKGMKRR